MTDAQKLSALQSQFMVGGDLPLARALFKLSTFKNVRKGKTIIEEGGLDDEIYLILKGVFSVYVGGVEIATRSAGNHIGEMALLDADSPRSATVVATTAATLAIIKAKAFSQLAHQHPQLWRALAVELARRNRALNLWITGSEPLPAPALPQE